MVLVLSRFGYLRMLLQPDDSPTTQAGVFVDLRYGARVKKGGVEH